jgi:hypothetical protein
MAVPGHTCTFISIAPPAATDRTSESSQLRRRTTGDELKTIQPKVLPSQPPILHPFPRLSFLKKVHSGPMR